MKLDFQLGNFIIHPTESRGRLALLKSSCFFEKWLPLNCFLLFFFFCCFFFACSSSLSPPSGLLYVRRPALEAERKGLHLRHISDYLSCQWLIHVMVLKSSYEITINYMAFNRAQSCIERDFFGLFHKEVHSIRTRIWFTWKWILRELREDIIQHYTCQATIIIYRKQNKKKTTTRWKRKTRKEFFFFFCSCVELFFVSFQFHHLPLK